MPTPKQMNTMLIERALERRRRPPRFTPNPYPKAIERAYNKDLQGVVKDIREEIERHLIPILPSVARDLGISNVRKDVGIDDITAAILLIRRNLSRKYTNEELARIARRRGISVREMNQQATERQFQRVLGVDIFTNDQELAQQLEIFSTLNVQLINSIIEESVNRVQSTVLTGFQQGLRHEEVAKQIEEYIDPVDGNVANRARFIARDQISKLNGQITQERQTNLGITHYIWRTSNDERVRESHRELEGKTIAWSDPPAVGHPGQDFNCRCTAEPILDQFFE